ncbi:hypothetical protein KIN20_003253 [Parelaphostrongylus tenuis]|uniref:Uncharacterized protein n=1 Tax=Parelaphostrongylus tenuis TaxID=148309 RepID=A0AAD5QIH4_PARTN|nr:hypothetical protein KIN20_003253 [Parelaphostrongylus tenuis]
MRRLRRATLQEKLVLAFDLNHRDNDEDEVAETLAIVENNKSLVKILNCRDPQLISNTFLLTQLTNESVTNVPICLLVSLFTSRRSVAQQLTSEK